MFMAIAWMELTPQLAEALPASLPFETNRHEGEEWQLFRGTSFRAVSAKAWV